MKRDRHLKVRSGLLLFTIFLSSCAYDTVATGLTEYVNQGILNISALEKRSFEAYASVVGENYTTDEAVYGVLKDEVIPIYERYVYLLKKIDPQEPEIKDLHKIYVQGAELIDEGFRLKMRAIEMKDEALIRRGNDDIVNGYQITEKWREELMRLYKLHGVHQKNAQTGKSR